MNYLPPFLLSTIAIAASLKEDVFIFVIFDVAVLFALPAIILTLANANKKKGNKFLEFNFINKKILFMLMIGCGAAYLLLLYWSLPYWLLLHTYLIFFFASIHLILMIKSKSD